MRVPEEKTECVSNFHAISIYKFIFCMSVLKMYVIELSGTLFQVESISFTFLLILKFVN